MKDDSRGFTLIEVLIALAVLAIALVAFVSAGAQNAEYASYIHNRTIAEWVAQNQLVEYQLASTWPSIGTQSNDVTMADQNWHWQATIESSPDPQVRRINVHVYTIDPATGKPATDPVASLSGFVTQHPKAVNDTPSQNDSTPGTTDNQNTATGA